MSCFGTQMAASARFRYRAWAFYLLFKGQGDHMSGCTLVSCFVALEGLLIDPGLFRKSSEEDLVSSRTQTSKHPGVF